MKPLPPFVLDSFPRRNRAAVEFCVGSFAAGYVTPIKGDPCRFRLVFPDGKHFDSIKHTGSVLATRAQADLCAESAGRIRPGTDLEFWSVFFAKDSGQSKAPKAATAFAVVGRDNAIHLVNVCDTQVKCELGAMTDPSTFRVFPVRIEASGGPVAMER